MVIVDGASQDRDRTGSGDGGLLGAEVGDGEGTKKTNLKANVYWQYELVNIRYHTILLIFLIVPLDFLSTRRRTG